MFVLAETAPLSKSSRTPTFARCMTVCRRALATGSKVRWKRTVVHTAREMSSSDGTWPVVVVLMQSKFQEGPLTPAPHVSRRHRADQYNR